MNELKAIKEALESADQFAKDPAFYRANVSGFRSAFRDGIAAVERLEAERQSDTEILDWMEKYPDFQVNTYTQAGTRQVHLVGGAGTAMCRVGSSIRSIIRAAIKSTKENANE